MEAEFEAEQQRVMGALEPYFGNITEICRTAVDLYNSETSARARAEHDSRAALCAIYSHAWKGYLREFGEEPGFHFMTVRGLNVLNVRDAVVLRAKRVDSNGRHTNHDSRQQRDFDRQQDIPGLPPAAVRVVVGYELDAAFSKVERIIVRRPLGQWSAQIVTVDDSFVWEDITPARLDFSAGRRAA